MNGVLTEFPFKLPTALNSAAASFKKAFDRIANEKATVQSQIAELQSGVDWRNRERVDELTEQLLDLVQLELAQRSELNKFYAKVEHYRGDVATTAAFAALEKAQRDIRDKLLAIGYENRTSGEPQSLTQGMVNAYPAVQAARMFFETVQAFDILPTRQVNGQEIELLEVKLANWKSKSLHALSVS